MKKFFSSGGGNDSSFVGKTFIVGRCPCVVEEVIAEGKLKVSFFLFALFSGLIRCWLMSIDSLSLLLSWGWSKRNFHDDSQA